ncbi:hypothetical protein, partial [Paracoccus rhizosphaerae]
TSNAKWPKQALGAAQIRDRSSEEVDEQQAQSIGKIGDKQDGVIQRPVRPRVRRASAPRIAIPASSHDQRRNFRPDT